MIDIGSKDLNQALRVTEKTIYHYTSADVLPVFFEEKADLYCTNSKSLNDPTEVLIGAFGFADYLHKKDRLSKERCEFLKQCIRQSIDVNWTDVWVMSLSRCGDALAQWRGYTSAIQGGYAIGFNTERLVQALRKITGLTADGKNNAILTLTRCWYSNRDIRLICSLYDHQYDAHKEDFERFAAEGPDDQESIRNVVSTIVPSSMQIKHQAFSDEEEARITLTAKEDAYSKMKVLGSKPRLPVGIPLVCSVCELIDEIIISPHGNKSSLINTAQWLKRRCGTKGEHIKIKLSSIPYDPSR